MQKNAWTYTMAGTVFAAVAVMLHWLQVQKIFDPETGLPTLHAPITTLLVVVLVLVAAALWWLSGRMKTDCAPEEPEDALALPHRETGWILIAAAALAALGSAYLFFKEDSTLMKAAALLGILSAPVLAMMPQIPAGAASARRSACCRCCFSVCGSWCSIRKTLRTRSSGRTVWRSLPLRCAFSRCSG